MAVSGLAKHDSSPGNPFGTTSGPGPANGDGTGVLGASGSGTGVLGVSGTGFSGITPQNMPGNGVLGASGTGAGVFGKSDEGIGVYGQSTQGRGGVFECSKTVAQVRLVPVEQGNRVPALPKEGKVGDLLLLRNTIFVGNDILANSCSLWLCIPRDSTDNSDMWQEVALGQVVRGTL
jgi:hypothetical protein